MERGLRVVLFNADEAAATSLRSALLGVDGVKVVAEVDEPALLPEAVRKIPAEVLFVHLDPDPQSVLSLAGEAARNDSAIAVIAVSESTDGQLILSAMRMGIKEFLTKPLDPKELSQALERVAQSEAERAVQGRLITVIGSAGGVGATSLATNLGVELAVLEKSPKGKDDSRSGNGVVVVDLDHRFGQVGTFLDVEPTFTIADLTASPEQLESSVIERALAQHDTGVKVLCRPNQFADAENITAADCVGVLSALTNLNAYVVVDGPSRFDVGAQAVFDLADVNLLVIQLVVPCVRSAHRMLNGMRDAGYNLSRTHVICNRTGREGGSVSVDDVEATLGIEVFATIPDDWATMSNCANMGEALIMGAEKSKVRLALYELATRLHERAAGNDDKEGKAVNRKGRSLLSKIFTEA
jgi:pilus assembly protein CpaE